MELIEFESKEKLRDFIKQKYVKVLGAGREGTCYLMPEGYVIKKLNDEYYESYIEKFEGIDIQSFVFAFGGIIVNEFVIALMLRYIDGPEIVKVNFEKYELELLKNALNILSKDIKELSERGIKAIDVYERNILFDGKLFSLIDAQCYEFNSYPFLEGINNVTIMKEIYKNLFSKNMFATSFLLSSEFKDYLYDYYLLSHPGELIDGIKDEFYRKYHEELNTLDDMKRVLRVK